MLVDNFQRIDWDSGCVKLGRALSADYNTCVTDMLISHFTDCPYLHVPLNRDFDIFNINKYLLGC